MSEQFHQQLNQLAHNAKQSEFGSRQRQRIIDKICRIILASPELRRNKEKLFKDYHARDSNITKTVFQECYADALFITTLEVLQKKIDEYNPGEAYILGVDWQAFNQDLQNNPENSSALAEDFIEKIDCYRQSLDESLKRRQDYRQDQSERLMSICTGFADSIKQTAQANSYSTEKLNILWKDFTKEVSTCDRSKNFFHWFIFILRYRFIDCKNKALNYRFKKVKTIDPETDEVVINPNTGKPKYTRIFIPPKFLDAPISNDSKKNLADTLSAKPDLDQTLKNLIKEDPDGIFKAKYSKKYREVNFRDLQLLYFQNYSCEAILSYFDNRIPLGSISSFKTRSTKYFRPILEEYITGRFPLTESVIDKIRQDLKIMSGRKKDGMEQKKKPSAITIKQRSNINFQDIIIQRKDNFHSWQLLAEHLNLSSKDLILFYLDNLQKSELYQTIAQRRQQQ